MILDVPERLLGDGAGLSSNYITPRKIKKSFVKLWVLGELVVSVWRIIFPNQRNSMFESHVDRFEDIMEFDSLVGLTIILVEVNSD